MGRWRSSVWALLQNWGAGARSSKDTPTQLMGTGRKSPTSGSPSPQGPQGLGEGLRKERRALTLYHSGVVHIDHDGRALGALLGVGGEGGQVGLAAAHGAAGLQQRLLAGVRAAALLLRQVPRFPLGELGALGAALPGAPQQIGVARRDPVCPAAGTGEEKRCEKMRG